MGWRRSERSAIDMGYLFSSIKFEGRGRVVVEVSRGREAMVSLVRLF